MKKIFLFVFALSFCAGFMSCNDSRTTSSVSHMAIYENGTTAALPNPLPIKIGASFSFQVVFYDVNSNVIQVAQPGNIIWSTQPHDISTWPGGAAAGYAVTLTVSSTAVAGSYSIKAEYGSLSTNWPIDVQN